MDYSKIGRPLLGGTSRRGRSSFLAPERYVRRLFLFHLERPLVVRTWNGWSMQMAMGHSRLVAKGGRTKPGCKPRSSLQSWTREQSFLS